jgi:hypothetical protein
MELLKERPEEEPPRNCCLLGMVAFLSYCLSKTCTSCVFTPAALTPLESTVVTFPSFETATLDVPRSLSPFLGSTLFHEATAW